MPPLEELYRRLLIAYPAGYREQHEAEILTTLIDAAEEGRRLPSPREAAGLLVGGLRTRGVIAGRQGWRTLWADALRVAAVLLLASRLADTQVLYLDAVGPRVRLVPVLLALGMVAAVRGAGRLSRGLLVLGGVVASVYWTQPVGGTMLTPQRLAADISEYVTPLYRAPAVAPVVLAMGLILWQVFLRAARRPWSWWLAVALVAYALVLQLSEREGIWSGLEGLGHVVAAVSLPRLALPGVLLVGLSLIAADPRPALGAALYAGCSLLGALSVHLAYGRHVDNLWGSEFVIAAVIATAGVAATTEALVRRRRLAHL